MRLAFSSDRIVRRSPDAGAVPLSALAVGARGVIADVSDRTGELTRVERLLALGVTPGAAVTMLQTFPGIVFRCDQTELAVERGVADAVFVRLEETLR